MMRKFRAIIYDDEIILLNVLKKWMALRGYDVLAYTEPKICPIYNNIFQNCTHEYRCADVVITDFKMPLMNGLELFQHQAKRGCKLDISHKAVISGYLEKENINKISKMGVPFFQKPLDIENFSSWLSECEQRVDLSIPLSII